MNSKKGFYLVFEGLHGSGKSTQARLLLKDLKIKFPRRKISLTFEPGGSEIASAIRQIVQATKFKERMSPICDAYLYAAARAQSLRSVVAPVLRNNGIVIADRCYLSSLAIQGICQGLGVETVLAINHEALRDLEPDLVFIVDIDPKIIKKRLHDKSGDKFENRKLSFYKKLRLAYRKLAKLFPKKLILIDGSGSESEVFQRVLEASQTYLQLP